MIRDAKVIDSTSVCDIYNHYILETIVTFEERPVTVTDMTQRIADVDAESLPWLVAEQDGIVVGYAYATRWRSRDAYRFSVETTVYLAPDSIGNGIGTALYSALLQRLRDRKLHVAVGGVALPNPASVALHEKFGFRKTAHFSEVGFKFGKWIDVAYWQVML